MSKIMIRRALTLAAAATGLLLLAQPATAQQSAKVIATCGTATYTAGTVNYSTMDTTGAACGTSAGGGGTVSSNIAQVNGATVNVGPGAAGAGTMRVTTSTDSTIGTVSAVTAITNALPAGAAILGKVGIDQTTPGTTNAVALTQIGATTIVTGGVAGSQGVGGVGAAGAALSGNPVLVGASDGTNARIISSDANGQLNINAKYFNESSSATAQIRGNDGGVYVDGKTANGSAIGGTSNPVLIGGSDGTNARSLKTATTGDLVVDQGLINGAGTASWAIQGPAANNASAAGNPVPASGLAASAEPTLATNGQNAEIITDLAHKLIVLPYANPENFVSGTTAAMTGTTSTVLLAAPSAGLRNYLTSLQCVNSQATVGTFVTVQDGSGGTALLTVAAASVFGGSAITLPTPLRQPTTATGLYVADVTTGANVICSGQGYKGS